MNFFLITKYLKMETQNLEIEQFIKSNLPDKLANGLSREDACLLYMAKNKVEKNESGLVLIEPVTGRVITNRRLDPIPVDEHVRSFVESFGKLKTEMESLSNRSQVDEYFEKNNTPISERSGILIKAMKNEGFKMTE